MQVKMKPQVFDEAEYTESSLCGAKESRLLLLQHGASHPDKIQAAFTG